MIATKPRALATGALMAMLIAHGAEAAKLSPHGTVLINRGNGFERVVEPCECHPGDMVMVNDGLARLEYADGRGSELQPGQVHTCGNDALAQVNEGGAIAGAAGGLAGLSGTAVALGAVAGVVAVAGVIAIGTGDTSKSD